MKTWFKVWLVLFAVLLLLSVVVPAMAAELQSADAALPAGTETIETESMEASDQESESLHPEATTESEEVESDVQSTEEVREVIEYNLELSEPIQVIPVEPAPVYEVNPDDYNGSSFISFAINGDVYSGSYNSTVISLWNGLLQNNIGKDYIAYRASQYEYYIFFGEDFEYSGGVFTGSGTYHYLNTYGNQYGYSVGSDSFTIDAADNFLYTNVAAAYPGLETERGLLYEQIQIVMLGALLLFIMFKWIFAGR